jgi:RNA polymerase sigma-70 factor (ECF subfamily)
MEEPELVIKLKAGDDEAFRTVVGQYQKLVLNCSYKFLRSTEAAEDMTQEVFVEVFESIHAFRSDAKLSTWIYRITVTKCLNHLKSIKRKKRFAVLLSIFDGDDMEKQIEDPHVTGPFHALENEERKRVLAGALEKLPANQRIAFTLSKYDDMSYEEISLVMDTSVSAIESLIHRAKTGLRKTLFRYYTHHL